MRDYFYFFLMLFSSLAWAQEECQHQSGANGSLGVPIVNSSSQSKIAAIDLDIDALELFSLESIEINISSDEFPLYDYFINIYKGNLNNLIESQELSLSGFVSTTPGVFKLTFDLNQSIDLSGEYNGKKYWIGLSAISNGTSEDGHWTAIPFTGTGSNQPLFYTTDGGQNWSNEIPGTNTAIEAGITVYGNCQTLEPSDSICNQGVSSNNYEGGNSIDSPYQYAVDLLVPINQNFTLNQMNLTVFSASKIAHMDFLFYKDDNGLPGELIASQMNVVPSSDTYIQLYSEISETDVRELEFELAPIEFPGQIGELTHYWVSLLATNQNGTGVWWETTSIETKGHEIAFYHNGVWKSQHNKEGVYEFIGECEDLINEIDCDRLFNYPENNGNYTNNDSQTWTFTPENGKIIRVEFSDFSTEEGKDGLMIYDGPDNTYPIISSGFITGNETCPNGAWSGAGAFSAAGKTFFSTHPSGMLTFEFKSDNQNSAEGWTANVTCVEQGTDGHCLPGQLNTPMTFNSYGLAGNMFNVTSLSNQDLEIQKFDIHMTSGKKTVNVYYRAGGYEGFENDSSAWTLAGSQLTIGQGHGQKTPLKIGGIIVPAEETYGIYIKIDDYVLGQGITLPYNSNDYNTYSDDKLKISPGLMTIGEGWGETTTDQDIVWQGSIYYCEGGEDFEYEAPCLIAEYGQYPNHVFVPGCHGYPTPITNIGWRGEYSMVQVTKGIEYTFSSSIESDLITIADELGVLPIISGEGVVTWTADFDGLIRFYTHADESCGHDKSQVISRFVQCGELYIVEEPEFDCFFGDGLESNSEAGSNIKFESGVIAADDFIIDSDTFLAKQIRLNIISKEPISEVRFSFWEDIFGPGGQGPASEPFLTTDFFQPTNQTHIGQLGSNNSHNIYEVTFDLPEPIEFLKGTYWMTPEVIGDIALWEATSTGNTGNYLNNGYNGQWVPFTGMNAIFFISGDCEKLDLNDWSDFNFYYYPNPVEDYLNIESSREIQSIHVYNLIGQNVFSVKKPIHSNIDLSGLTKGVYLFKVILNNQQIETFKIIKK